MMNQLSIQTPVTGGHRLRRQRGFTLIEIMVVVALIALLAALALPVFQHLSRGEVSEADQQFGRIVNELNTYRSSHTFTVDKMLEYLGTYNCLAISTSDCAATSSVAKMVPMLTLSPDAKFRYTVKAGKDEKGVIQYCITAHSLIKQNATVLFSSRRTLAPTWENHISLVKYLDTNNEHDPAGHCTSGGDFSDTCTQCQES